MVCRDVTSRDAMWFDFFFFGGQGDTYEEKGVKVEDVNDDNSERTVKIEYSKPPGERTKNRTAGKNTKQTNTDGLIEWCD